MTRDSQILDAIAALLSGKEWSPDTTQSIADLVKLTGREIQEPEREEAE